MKLNILILMIIVVASSCTSLDGVQKNPKCVVWKDQKYLGPYSVEVAEKKVHWLGVCPNKKKSKCDVVDISSDEEMNVFRDDVNLGKINNDVFNYVLKADQSPLMNYSSVGYSAEKKMVTADTVTYQTNGKCSAQEAIVGGIALGLIESIQKNN